jgi:hypothetical protein
MLKQIHLAVALIAVLMLAPAVLRAAPQDTPKHASDAVEPGHSYRLDFTMNEMEDGKKINSRQYSMNLNAGDANEIKIGTRVPVEVKQGEIQYLDVGTNIWCQLHDRSNSEPSVGHGLQELSWLGNDVKLNVRAELSNFSMPDQQGQSTRPTIRQVKIDSSTIATLGKSMLIGAVDDPNSKRQFQLEVTVTKLK